MRSLLAVEQKARDNVNTKWLTGQEIMFLNFHSSIIEPVGDVVFFILSAAASTSTS